MKNFCFFSTLCFLTASLLYGDTSEWQPASTDPFGSSLKKYHHEGERGPRGHRGHRGPRGHKGRRGLTGPTGPSGDTLPPAYISLSYTTPTLDLSQTGVGTPLIPFGDIDLGTVAHYLQYVDPDPSDLFADRYVEVLPGGGGTYIIAFSIFSKTASFINQEQVVLRLQAQANFGLGWYTALPFNNALTVFNNASMTEPAYYASSGTSSGMLYLPDGGKFRVAILTATQYLSIGLDSAETPPSRDVSISLIRISPSM